jgi:amyloid beta precursor protein binding protein 1
MLPLPGSVPDMKSRSADYIALQNVYKSKARADVAEIVASVREIEASLAEKYQDSFTQKTPIEESEVEAFCKNAAHIKLIRGKPLPVYREDKKHEWTWGDRTKFAFNACSDETSLMCLHIAFMAWDAYYQGLGMVAGEMNPDTDALELTRLANGIVDKLVLAAGKPLVIGDFDHIRGPLGDFCKEL